MDGFDGKVVKISVTDNGAIRLDGQETPFTNVREHLASLAGTEAVVWYHRANGQEDAPEEAMLVLRAIVDNGLPVSLSSEPDFSTVVLPDGSVHPR